MADLNNELERSALSVGALDIQHLRKFGALNRGVAEMGLKHHQFGVAPVIPVDGGLFEVADGGRRHLIVPVHEGGDLLDLVACSTSTPDHWLLRTGAGLALGLFDGWEPHRWAESVHLYRNPLDWLAGGGDGLCIVDWSAPELYLLNDLKHIAVETDGLRCQLQAALQRPSRIVPIDVVQETRLAA